MRNRRRFFSTPVAPIGSMLLAALVALSACSPRIRQPVNVALAVENLRTGAVVRAVEEALAETRSAASQTGPSAYLQISPERNFQVLPIPGSCEQLELTPEAATDDQAEQDLQKLMSCYRDLLAPGRALTRLIGYYRYFEVKGISLSLLSPDEIRAFLELRRSGAANWMDIRVGLAEPRTGERLRIAFNSEELAELLALVERRNSELAHAEEVILDLSARHRGLLERHSLELDRYAVLLALLDTREDREGAITARSIERVTGKRFRAEPVLSSGATKLLHPHALTSLIPESGREFGSLHRTREDPFAAAQSAYKDLGGTRLEAEKLASRYETFRRQDNPGLPSLGASAPDALKVGFIDSGIDFVRFPELGLYLGSSRDFSDDDSNPWLPAVREDFAHGSATAATLLTVMSRAAPSLLREGKVELRFWKVQSLRQLLSPVAADPLHWESRSGVHRAFLAGEDAALRGAAPKIVSSSMSVQLKELLERGGGRTAKAIARAPWLWVMAAGNASSAVETDPGGACFGDLSDEQRDRSKILCVGALVRGDLSQPDRVAGYSNFGDRVDVFAYESYTDVCPNGTSCATPAITAAVSVLAVEFPALTPAQLRAVILKAARTRELRVDSGETVREIRFFDPETMMDEARKAAQLLMAVPETVTR